MLDFERLIDNLRAERATSPEQRAWAKGYAAGKAIARLECAVVFGVAVVAFAALLALEGG